jgi:tagatose 1,6-diphosphate aldolase GatY/KbaY
LLSKFCLCTVDNLEGVKAVIKAAEITHSPIIIQVHPASLEFGGVPFLDLLASYRQCGVKCIDSNIIYPIFIQFDHITSPKDVELILQWNKADGIMIDGSHKPLHENIQWTKLMVSNTLNVGERNMNRNYGIVEWMNLHVLIYFVIMMV